MDEQTMYLYFEDLDRDAQERYVELFGYMPDETEVIGSITKQVDEVEDDGRKIMSGKDGV